MAAVINTNYLSLVAQGNLTKSQSALGSAIERLSSGMRINSAKDDAAGQAIANRFTANVKGLTQAARNANDGISISQTTEGALNEINNNLQRVRELTNQAVTGTNSSSDLKSIQDEIQQRLDEIDRVSAQTQFNGVKVLAGDNTLKIQVGANDNETISINLKKIDASSLGLSGFNVDGAKKATAGDLISNFGATGTHNFKVGGDTFNVDINSGAVTTGGKAAYVEVGTGDLVTDPTKDNTALTTGTASSAGSAGTLATALATAGAGKNAGDKFTVDGIEYTRVGAADADGNGGYTAKLDGKDVTFTIADADTTATVETDVDVFTSVASGKMTTRETEDNKVATQTDLDLKEATATGSTLKLNGATYNVGSDGAVTLQAGATPAASDKVMYMSRTAAGNPTLINEDQAKLEQSTNDPLKTLDNALAKVDALRSELGAVQNRFESTISNLNNTVNNLSAARSRIEDADYATEVSNMTRAQILQQAGTSVLAQANQVPQTVLSLLR
ncbi:flagellin N-terminal helical domain-containing protein [Bordetella trematum]|uniref:flagellin N-terminal helical domain-containing protein n=1 Tax=Bordetella trematum TaxID=123899 RepID=UPI000D9972E1|nr:flagellin [Bordetella trematum]SPU50652.1 flagellin [Bordetella trematum]VDH06901.1 Phase 1-I flagellin [Bordetella trematum]